MNKLVKEVTLDLISISKYQLSFSQRISITPKLCLIYLFQLHLKTDKGTRITHTEAHFEESQPKNTPNEFAFKFFNLDNIKD